MVAIPDAHHDLFERPTFAHLATLLPDGTPHVTPVWVDYDVDDERVLVNTARDRRKTRNVQRDPRVGLSMTDPDDPYRRLSATGRVEAVTTEGADDHIDRLAHRYLGRDYDRANGAERVLLSIRLDRVF